MTPLSLRFAGPPPKLISQPFYLLILYIERHLCSAHQCNLHTNSKTRNQELHTVRIAA